MFFQLEVFLFNLVKIVKISQNRTEKTIPSRRIDLPFWFLAFWIFQIDQNVLCIKYKYFMIFFLALTVKIDEMPFIKKRSKYYTKNHFWIGLVQGEGASGGIRETGENWWDIKAGEWAIRGEPGERYFSDKQPASRPLCSMAHFTWTIPSPSAKQSIYCYKYKLNLCACELYQKNTCSKTNLFFLLL